MKDNKTKEATKEQLDYLYNNMGETISFMYPSLLNSIRLYNLLISFEEDFDNKALLINIVRINYQVLFTHLDIATIFRAELRADTPWEKRMHLKYVYAVLTEAFKALFGFDTNKQTLWKKFCDEAKGFIGEDERVGIELQIDQLRKNHLDNTTEDFRKYVVHYDYDPLKVYDFWSVISEQKEVDFINSYLTLSLGVWHLIEKVLGSLGLEIKHHAYANPVFSDFSIWERINNFPDRDDKLLGKMKEGVARYVSSLDSLVKDYRLPNRIETKLGIDNITPKMQQVLESVHPLMFLDMISIDIGCVVIAYLTSQHYIEKQLNLRHLNVIVYEGFNKLYGFDHVEPVESEIKEAEKPLSYWKSFLYPIIMDSGSDEWKEKARNIEIQLQQLSKDSLIDDEELRLMSVHIRKKNNKDYIPNFSEKLIKMNPIIEMSRALKLLGIVRDVMWLNKEVINIQYSKIKAVQDKELDGIKSNLKSICSLFLQFSNDESAKRKVRQTFDEILSLIDM